MTDVASDHAQGRWRVLFICTGNQCRSPMAEAFLRAKVPRDCGICVTSAGMVADGTSPPKHAVRAMARAGIDIAGRSSRKVVLSDLEEADLIIVMARQHLFEVTTIDPASLERSFTFVDLIRRARSVGGPETSESLSQWARRMSAGRTHASILSLAASDDIADPAGGTPRDYKRAARVLDRLTSDLATLLIGAGPAPFGRPRVL